MRIAYLEDLKEHREQVLPLIEDWIRRKSPTSSVAVFPDAKSFLFKLEDTTFDVLLLDILMPGLDGMSLAKKLRDRGDESLIVFLTGERDFVFEGYKVAAMDYLLKPIQKAELEGVLTRAQEELEHTVPEVVLDTGDGLESVRLDRVAAIEVRDKELLFTLAETRNDYTQKVIRGSLNDWIQKIRDLGYAESFLQIHRSYLCHIGHVQRLESDTVELRDGSRLPVARSRRKEVQRQYLDYRKSMARDKSKRG